MDGQRSTRNETGASQDDKFRLSAPQITLPKGGGAIRGIGEKFGANPVTGTGSFTVPLYASPGRSGFGPQLSLSYDSGSGNGPFGFGWTLALPQVARKTDKGLPQYADAQESDTFILSGAEDLVPSLLNTGSQWVRDISQPRTVHSQQYTIHRYRPRVEGLFARIERWVNLTDPQDTFWRSISKDNITTWYGKTAESRIADPFDPTRIFSWLICESYDNKGNVVVYKYKPEDSVGVDLSQANERNRSDTTRSAQRYIQYVFYGNRSPYFPDLTTNPPSALPTDWCFQLVFDYGEYDVHDPVPSDTGKPPWICRSDPFSTCRSTFEVRTYRLCQHVLMFHHFKDETNIGLDCLVRSTDFVYSSAPPPDPTQPFYSFLLSVKQSGYVRTRPIGYPPNSLPPLQFEYTQAEVDETVREVDSASLRNIPYGIDGNKFRWVDLDGEGVSGILTEQGGGWFYKPNLSPANRQSVDGQQLTVPQFGPVQLVARQPSLASLSSGRQQLMDLSGDGQLDLVEFDSPTPGFFERTEDADWEPFQTFQSLPVLDWQNPNLKFIDLTGDGFPDLLISEDNAFWSHASLSTEGFGPAQRVAKSLDEENGPQLAFADGTESIFLADMSGDGLTDLVRVRLGEVCYWPNLGYGRFGSKVIMDQSPVFDRPDLFDGRRIHLADIDGSGTADIIYFAGGKVHLYFNQSGNAWGPAHTLVHFPAVDSISSATVLDLLGNGTACLVWSSSLTTDARRPMRYIDLMGGQKPHLLTHVTNNLGAETIVQYAPSTKFYVADKLAGAPWLTRLPFPVHVVEGVESYDYVSRNRFVTRYAYHHGYYDGAEREFRGFGRVDQWDTEEFATLSSTSNFLLPSNEDPASNVPPTWTKTWFHTGAFFGESVISKHLEQEYYSEGDSSDAIAGLSQSQLESMLLDDTVLPNTVLLPDGSRIPYDLSGEEMREACRALRGSILRQEIYALDNTDASDRPYSASERNYTVEVIQPQGPNRYAVFLAHPRETIDYHYERKLYKVVGNALADQSAPPPGAINAADPRVTHAVTLAVDPFGNVLQSVAIGYGRRYADPALTSIDQTKQSTLLTTYTVRTYTNAILLDDSYRTPLPAESSTYELIQFQPNANQPGITNLFRFDELQKQVEKTTEVSYEDLTPPPGARRLLERIRTLYRPDDMGTTANGPQALLPLGKVQPLALPGSGYKLAFTPELISQVYQRGGAALLPTPADVLGSVKANGGGYVDLDGDGHWWMPSGRMFYFPTATTSSSEKAEALSNFYLPRRFEDPFGNATSVDYDKPPNPLDRPYNLLAIKTVDALGNTVTASNDYRVLAPTLLTDPNGSNTEVRFDILGMVAGTSVYKGKSGDSFATFNADLTQTQIDNFYAADDPHTLAGDLLGTATTRIVYDVQQFFNTRQTSPNDPTKWLPVFAASIAREAHVSDLGAGPPSKLQITFSYSDGFGREIQKKIQAEPGRVVNEGPVVNLRWVGSGWTIFNNKGMPVRRFEPFFSTTHDFEFAVLTGVSPILFYDPIERVVATLHPNQTWEKVVFDPWQQETWDVNDTVLVDPQTDLVVAPFFDRLLGTTPFQSWYSKRIGGGPSTEEQEEQKAAQKSAVHDSTPAIAYFDTLRRSFLTIAHNRKQLGGPDEFYATRLKLDIEGNQREVLDALDRVVMRYDYDMLGNRIHQDSMDAGERWMLNDVAGRPLRAWDSRGHTFLTSYDELRRPIFGYVDGADASDPSHRILFDKIIYGDSQSIGMTPTQVVANNLRGKIYRHFDTAGLVTNPTYDFKGNLSQSERTLIQDYRVTPDWSATAQPPLEPETFVSSTRYDALNRPTQSIAPHVPGSTCNVLQPTYNDAGLLETEFVWLYVREPSTLLDATTATQQVVKNIDYNEKGQRELIAYGNGASTKYVYEQETFRLKRLTTTRPPSNGMGSVLFVDTTVVQDLSYTYDPTGNITSIFDGAFGITQYNNEQISSECSYIYDAIYRLIKAEGREHIGQTAFDFAPPVGKRRDFPFVGLRAAPNDLRAVRNYTESYNYDPVGNFESIAHNFQGGGWARTYEYAAGRPTNRLLKTIVGTLDQETYNYIDAQGKDVHGCMTAINSMTMEWNFKDELQSVYLGGGGTAYYVYDAAGKRVRKVIEGQGGNPREERFYLGGIEVYRDYRGGPPAANESPQLVRESLHITDDKQRIALVETKMMDNGNIIPVGSLVPLWRCQLGNHLGSAALELDDKAELVTYEEYHPYGTSSYQAVSSSTEVPTKRYRYTGKERDEETGFCYQGARYYASWIGNWTSCDPVDLRGGINLYTYGARCPIGMVDPSGKAPKKYEDQRGRDTYAKSREMNKNLEEARKKGYTPDPMQKRADDLAVKRGRTPIEQHHHRDVQQSAEVKLDPKEMGDPMSSVWSTKIDPTVKAGIGDKPHYDPSFKGDERTHHNIAKMLDKSEQAQRPKNAKGLKDAAAASKSRYPATADLAERAKMDWTRSTPKGPPVDPLTGKVISETVTPGTKGLRFGAGLGSANAIANGLDGYLMALDKTFADKGWVQGGLAILEDENGTYTVEMRPGIIFNDYSKRYLSGKLEGTSVDLGFFEFSRELKKRDEKYGHMDWKADFVPGKEPVTVIDRPLYTL